MIEPGKGEELVAEDPTEITEVPLEALEVLSGGGPGENLDFTFIQR